MFAIEKRPSTLSTAPAVDEPDTDKTTRRESRPPGQPATPSDPNRCPAPLKDDPYQPPCPGK